MTGALETWRARPRAQRLARLEATPGELARALDDAPPALLARRPAPAAWAPVEVLCHLRDAEESFLDRCRQIAASPLEPRFPTTNPDRWAAERQYLRHDPRLALAAFARLRAETLALFRGLAEGGWARAGVQLDSRGRRTLDDFLAVMAWHDANHLDQLARALAGRA